MTVQELTNGERLSIRPAYGGSNIYKNKKVVSKICSMLNACGISIEETDEFNYSVGDAIMEFQKNNNINTTGILDDNTLEQLINKSGEVMDDEIIDKSEDGEYVINSEDVPYPHYDTFFSRLSEKEARRTHKDIKITFGDGQISKVIKEVIMHSIGVEIDTSGNPVSETYQFIARDLIESDAPEDVNKYIGDEKIASSPSDIKYNFEALKKYQQ